MKVMETFYIRYKAWNIINFCINNKRNIGFGFYMI